MVLRKCILFQYLSHESILKIIAKLKQRLVAKNEVVIREG